MPEGVGAGSGAGAGTGVDVDDGGGAGKAAALFLGAVGRVVETASSRSRPLMSLCVVEYCRRGSCREKDRRRGVLAAVKQRPYQ